MWWHSWPEHLSCCESAHKVEATVCHNVTCSIIGEGCEEGPGGPGPGINQWQAAHILLL